MFGITRNLSLKGCEVTVLAINTPKHFQNEDVLGDMARLVTVFIDTTISPLKAFKNLFKPLPYIVERFVSEDFSQKLRQLLTEETFDIIHFEGTFVSFYVDLVKKMTNTPVVLRSHNLEHMIWDRLSENEKNPLKKIYFKRMSQELRRFEKAYYSKFDAIAAITPEDIIRIKSLGIETPCTFVPAGVDLDRFVKKDIEAEPKSCFILSALNWIPNQEALLWFLDQVWPKVLEKIPDLKLHVAGKGTPDWIKKIEYQGVFIHGYVEDASLFIQQYELMLVPLLSGGGMRLKIVEGMALEKCIVSSPVGAEGINCTDGENILICSTPEEWSDRIIAYFLYPEKFSIIGKNAGSLIREEFENSKVIDRLLKLYKSLIR